MSTPSTESWRRRGWRLGLAGLCLATSLAAQTERTVDRLQTAARGLFLLWSEGRPDQEQILQQPFLHGGQVTLQWADLEPRPEGFDFTALDRKIGEFAGRGRWFTIQINGNHKPDWLFEQVPFTPRRLHSQVQDERGTLMFWHPRFEQAHLGMLRAVAAHLRASPTRDHLLGIRLNFNAIGTEQTAVPPDLRDPAQWTFPLGCDRAGLPVYTDAVRNAYLSRALAVYREEFSSWVLVFVRNLVDGELLASIADDLRSGRMALFHTSSEVEPRTGPTERRYGLFYDYARTGGTVAYAEPWASAWGEHGGKNDVRWCSPCQWNYWTLLLDLHCGVSFIGEYYINLHFALTGDHPRLLAQTVKPAEQAKEFLAAYQWTDRYAGRHNRPEEAPGAWVAFRENHEIKAKNGEAPSEAWKLTRFTGDYTFLMSRLEGDGSVGVGPVGPPEQRYGAFARSYPVQAVARLKLDPEFLRSVATQSAVVRVIYLDAGRNGDGQVALITTHGAVPLGRLVLGGTGRWVTAEFELPAEALRAAASDRQIEVKAGAAPLTLHLVEVVRKTPAPANSFHEK